MGGVMKSSGKTSNAWLIGARQTKPCICGSQTCIALRKDHVAGHQTVGLNACPRQARLVLNTLRAAAMDGTLTRDSIEDILASHAVEVNAAAAQLRQKQAGVDGAKARRPFSTRIYIGHFRAIDLSRSVHQGRLKTGPTSFPPDKTKRRGLRANDKVPPLPTRSFVGNQSLPGGEPYDGQCQSPHSKRSHNGCLDASCRICVPPQPRSAPALRASPLPPSSALAMNSGKAAGGMMSPPSSGSSGGGSSRRASAGAAGQAGTPARPPNPAPAAATARPSSAAHRRTTPLPPGNFVTNFQQVRSRPARVPPFVSCSAPHTCPPPPQFVLIGDLLHNDYQEQHHVRTPMLLEDALQEPDTNAAAVVSNAATMAHNLAASVIAMRGVLGGLLRSEAVAADREQQLAVAAHRQASSSGTARQADMARGAAGPAIGSPIAAALVIVEGDCRGVIEALQQFSRLVGDLPKTVETLLKRPTNQLKKVSFGSEKMLTKGLAGRCIGTSTWRADLGEPERPMVWDSDVMTRIGGHKPDRLINRLWATAIALGPVANEHAIYLAKACWLKVRSQF